ncbi:MAG: hypothetical protein ABIL39_10710 [candidate division WOR-3 bacterium]
MKRILLMAIAFIMLSSLVFGATINLRATWTANTEPDMKEYRLYRIDQGRQLIGTIPHPQTQYDFSITVPDNSEGTLAFVLTAVDQAGNESADSNTATYPFDFKAPVAPAGLGVSKR